MILHWIFSVCLFTVVGIGVDYLISSGNKLIRIKKG